MLSQDTHIFSGTFADNVRYAKPEASNADIERATELAGLGQFVQSLPERYDTLLGQRGYGLSGGQKQRLALARVLLQDPPFVLFDEPSSSLDPENTHRFFCDVMESLRGKTVVVITHDLHDLAWADQVIYMVNGTIKEVISANNTRNRTTASSRNNHSFKNVRDVSVMSVATAMSSD
jgi:ATP-binding cassette subfamily B protein